MAYATLEELKREMGLLEEDADDELLQSKLTQAQDIIEHVTNRRFEASADETRLIDYSPETVNGRMLHLPHDLCQITSVVNGNGQTVAVTEYVTVPRLRSVSGSQSIMPAVPSAWPWYAIEIKLNASKIWTFSSSPEEAISITGRWAFSVTAPQTIKSVCLRLADWLYHLKDNPASEIRESETSEEGVMLLMADLPMDVQRRLLRFVRE